VAKILPFCEKRRPRNNNKGFFWKRKKEFEKKIAKFLW
jgi:hypothetical protein